ncbi:MAG: SAM-dependent methyltransferase [Kiloniellaceae bacterium]
MPEPQVATVGAQGLDPIHANYPEWRRAHRAVDLAAEHDIFARECARLTLPAGARILEVGFGEGLFLDWAREQGFHIEGVDISHAFVDAARARAHGVSHGTLVDMSRAPARPYDAIVCFDVLEHMTIDEIVAFFAAARRSLAPNGVICARFPNGGSPFGRVHQYGDVTHRTALTGLSVDQLARTAGLGVTGVFNAAQALGLMGSRARLLRCVASLIEHCLGRLYYGGRVPLDPNLVVHIRALE